MNLDFRKIVSLLRDPKSLVDKVSFAASVYRFKKGRASFYVDLADAIRDKEKISTFLAIRRTRALEQKEGLFKVYSRMHERHGDQGLAFIFEGVVPDADRMVILAIENSGRLDDGLRFLSTTVESQNQMKEALIGAMVMPTMVFLVGIAYVAIMAYFVIPVFESVAPHEMWGAAGAQLYALSYVFQRFGIALPVVFGAAVSGFAYSIRNWYGPVRAKFDRYLPYRVFRDYNGALFLVALASLLSTGETLVSSLEKLKRHASPWLRWHIGQIVKSLLSPTHRGSYGDAFSTGVFDRDLTNRLIDYSRRSSDFQGVIRRLGIEEIDKAKKAVLKSAQRLGILTAAFAGGTILYLIIATTLTSQSLGDAVRRMATAPSSAGTVNTTTSRHF